MDISYIPMRRGFVYPAAVVDVASRRALAHRVSITIEAASCVEALEEALARHGRPKIFNSDQGSQFTSVDFTSVAVGNRLARYENVAELLAYGPTRTTVVLRSGLQVDGRAVPEESYGAALLYFTGSKAHNSALRALAIDHGWKLNEYGLFAGKRRIAGATEEEVYKKLGLAFIPPELREDRGEVALAKADQLPRLVNLSDIRGDLHVHSDWTDGTTTIEAMADGARASIRLRRYGPRSSHLLRYVKCR